MVRSEEPLQRRQRNISLHGGDGEGVPQDVRRYRPADTRPVRHAVHVVVQARGRVLAPGVNEQVAANVEAAERIDVVRERRARARRTPVRRARPLLAGRVARLC